MAIFAYVGLPGHGKTYEVVANPILRASRETRPVWTNIECTLPSVYTVEPERKSEHWYLEAPPGALVVIDECWRYWGSGLKADEMAEEQREFFAMHRHRTRDGRSTDIVLVCQDLKQVASFVRNLVERTFHCVKLTALGTRKKYRVDIYDGSVTGQKPPKSQLIGSSFGAYKAEVWKHYKSHTQGGAAIEVSPDNRGLVWKRASVLAIPVAFIFAPWLVVQAFQSHTGRTADKIKPPPVIAQAKVAAPVRPQVLDIEPEPVEIEQHGPDSVAAPGESPRWTLLGVVMRKNGTGVAMIESSIGRRTITLETCTNAGVEWTCLVDGHRVTTWTGQSWRRMASANTYNRSQD